MSKLTTEALRSFLDEKAKKYNTTAFIDGDPISIPHLFSKQEDIEIAAFLTATISWGQRKTILTNANKLMKLMDDAPHQFILSFKNSDLHPFKKFKHRTLNGEDCIFFLKALQSIYKNNKSLEKVFTPSNLAECQVKDAIMSARKSFFSIPFEKRQGKHFPNPDKGSAAKRLNMFLRWMVRKDSQGVDFGIWQNLSPSVLMCPLDIHSGRVARKLGLLHRNQDDWQAVTELSTELRSFDPNDPIKYDYALFGLGVFEKF